MSNSFWRKNLDALKKSNPVTWKALTDYAEDASYYTYALTPSRSGPPTCKVSHPEHGSWQLCSAYDPVKEGLLWAQNNIVPGKTQQLVFGFGLGYHVEALLPYVRETGRPVFVLDFMQPLYKDIFKSRDMSALLAEERIQILLLEDIREMKNALLMLVTPDNAVSAGLSFHQPSTDTHKEAFDECFGFLKNILNTFKMHIRSSKKLGRVWHMATLQNLPGFLESSTIAPFQGRFTGIPCIVVGAGPSLNKNIQALKGLQDRAVLFACGTALKPLLNEGIEPHFVGVGDANPLICRQIEGIDTSRFLLLSAIITHPDFITAFPAANRFFYHSGSAPFEFLLRLFDIQDTIFLFTGGNVASTGIAFGCYMSCDPVIMVGQDLALDPDAKIYADGTFKEEVTTSRPHSLEVPGETRDTVLTVPSFAHYLFLKESFFSLYTNTTFINATEGGARHKGALSMTLKDAAARYCAQERGIRDKLAGIQAEARPPADRASALRQLNILRAALQKDEKTLRTIEPFFDAYTCGAEGASRLDDQTLLQAAGESLEILDHILQSRI